MRLSSLRGVLVHGKITICFVRPLSSGSHTLFIYLYGIAAVHYHGCNCLENKILSISYEMLVL